MIPQDTVNRILDAAQIVDVVGDFVTLKKRELTIRPAVLFITKRLRRFLYLLPKVYTSVLAAASPARQSDL